MKIKVCGMRDAENIRAVETLGIDYMGFIFWSRSARYVGEVPAYLPEQCKRVGVFVDASLEDILASAESFRLDCIQFHGNESPGTIAAVRKVVNSVNPSISIIKSLSISETEDLRQTAMYEDVCDAFLFDTKGKLPGGNGRQFDWNILLEYGGRLPFLLSGGIGPEDAERIKAFSAPGFVGVDLNSRFETAPGHKDVTALKSFIEQLKQ